MLSVSDVSDMPTEGKSPIIVAGVQNLLQVQIFDANGRRVVDSDESQLLDKAPQFAELKSLVRDLWCVPQPSQSDKDRVITTVTSIRGGLLATAGADGTLSVSGCGGVAASPKVDRGAVPSRQAFRGPNRIDPVPSRLGAGLDLHRLGGAIHSTEQHGVVFQDFGDSALGCCLCELT